jgi:hypothetical chaperone protein
VLEYEPVAAADACEARLDSDAFDKRIVRCLVAPQLGLGGAELVPSDIDRMFLTGGSSRVPCVRKMFIDRFGPEKVTGGDEQASVATGFALRAREQWPDLS